MDALSFANPVFAAYAVAATLMILMVSATSWLTVARMIQVNGGFRSPEDLRKTPLNRNPDPANSRRTKGSSASGAFKATMSRISPSFSPPDCSTF